jgi:RND family efflux transporter MFP subunit
MVTVLGVSGAVALGVVGVWVSSGFTREPPPPPPEAPGMKVGKDTIALTPEAPQWKVLKVGPAQPATKHWTDAVPARVRIDETKASRVGTPLAGRVTQVFVEVGQPVKTGAPLFMIASPDIAGLRAEQEKAEVDLETAKTKLENVKSMVEDHALPKQEEIQANQELRENEVAFQLAEAKLGALRVSSSGINEFTVVAPRDGIVVEKNLLPGQEVSADVSDPLVEIADLSSVWVVADIFEADAAGISEGQDAEITSPSLPGLKLDYKVSLVSQVVDSDRHTVPVRVQVPNDEKSGHAPLKPNIFAEMRFSVDPDPGSVEIGASAIVSDGAHQYVYIQNEQGAFQKHEVVAGSAREGRVTVTQGLVPGQVVVEEGGILLDNQIDLSN